MLTAPGPWPQWRLAHICIDEVGELAAANVLEHEAVMRARRERGDVPDDTVMPDVLRAHVSMRTVKNTGRGGDAPGALRPRARTSPVSGHSPRSVRSVTERAAAELVCQLVREDAGRAQHAPRADPALRVRVRVGLLRLRKIPRAPAVLRVSRGALLILGEAVDAGDGASGGVSGSPAPY